jgi:prepilin-type N-terminal cleavage/methylation domain-containing protein
MKQKQSGFTLIEIAIVLVIIGLLLGGVLKGQELINSAKVKNIATDFRNVPVYIYGYQDKFRALPGDDKDAVTHLGASAVVSAASGVGNGTIDGNWDATGTAETNLFWQHIRMAGLAAGPTDNPATNDLHPLNAMGAKIGVSNAANSPVSGLKGSFIVCSDGIPGKFAKQLDIQMDDGKTDSGTMQATTGGVSTPTAAIGSLVDDTNYLVCMGF